MERSATHPDAVKRPRPVKRPRRMCSVAALVGLAVLLGLPAGASAQSTTEARGAQLLRAVEADQRPCEQLTGDDFTAIGEYVMGRMIGSPQGHQSMDAFMSQMMGAANEERVHESMGQRLAGCGSPAVPGGIAGMMGIVGMMGGLTLGPGGPGSVAPGGAYAPGSMMGFANDPGPARGGGGNDAPTGWMIAMMLVLVGGAGLGAYLIARSRGRPRSGGRRTDPRELLAQRFARGEIDAEEFQRRSALIGGAR